MTSDSVDISDDVLNQPGAVQHRPSTVSQSEHQKLGVHEVVGDIFDAPPNSVLIHACNCSGHWGAGIAAAFKKHYPAAHKAHLYACRCGPNGKAETGTAQLIPPVDSEERRHYVGCLFTSQSFGKRRDPEKVILENTGPAVEYLLRLVAKERRASHIGELRMCKINSGNFGVAWEKTMAVLQNIELEPGMPTCINVYEPGPGRS